MAKCTVLVITAVTKYLSGGSRGGARGPAPFFLDQTEARRAEKNFFLETAPPLPLISGSR